MKKIEFHVHTKYSKDSRSELPRLVEECLDKKIDVLVVTDHNEIEGAVRLKAMAPFQVIVGEEILTQKGEIIGLFLKDRIPPGLSPDKTISLIRKQGGLVYLPHPYDSFTRKTSVEAEVLTAVARKVDMIEVHNGRTIFPSDNQKALVLSQSLEKIPVVGSDAHTIFEIGRNYLEVPDLKTDIPKNFLLAIKEAHLVKSQPMLWPFLITKLDRFSKKHFIKNQSKYFSQTCDLCGGNNFEVVYSKKGRHGQKYLITDNSYGSHSQIVKCFACDLEFACPREKQVTINNRYQNFIDKKYEDEVINRGENYKRILSKLTMFSQSKRLLDIGCATGGLLQTAKRQGWTTMGLEPSRWASGEARKKGLQVISGSIESVKITSRFNTITCIDVIEHVVSPSSLLAKTAKFISSGGVFCVVTPNKNSLLSKVLGEKWWHIRPDHIYYFTFQTLKIMLIKHGFQVIKTYQYGWTFSYDYWISRIWKYSPFLYSILSLVKSSRTITINFHDSMEIYCQIT